MNRLNFGSGKKPGRPRMAAGSNPQLNKPAAGKVVRVLLADDHPVVRWGLSSSMAPSPRVKVVGEATNGAEAVVKAKELSPDVILMDIDMPEVNGLTATEILQRENPGIKVVLLSMHPYTNHMGRILKSGARGFLLKDTRPADIISAICRVASGETCFAPSVAAEALTHLAQRHGAEMEGKSLSQRECQVLVCIAQGMSNKEIARSLSVSARTVETHRSHIMHKLNIRTVAGLTRYAVSEGLVEIR